MSTRAASMHHSTEHRPIGDDEPTQDTFSSDIRGLPASLPTKMVELSDGDIYDLRVAPVASELVLTPSGCRPAHTPDRIYRLAEITVTAGPVTPDLTDRFGVLRSNADMIANARSTG